uniref:Uncharacterized protein n=1 Tax=Arundo donax TaxID=35708 RepID=A0A0A9H0L9_ARUDO
MLGALNLLPDIETMNLGPVW